MSYFYLVAFIAGLLLGVRLMFFGAERRRQRANDSMPLRRSEPAIVTFAVVFGLTGYLLDRHSSTTLAANLVGAAVIAAVCSALGTRVAIAAARMVPEHDPDDPRYVLQGRVAVVTTAIPSNGVGAIRYEDGGVQHSVAARNVVATPIDAGVEVCIERVEEGVAWVELWSLVEARL